MRFCCSTVQLWLLLAIIIWAAHSLKGAFRLPPVHALSFYRALDSLSTPAAHQFPSYFSLTRAFCDGKRHQQTPKTRWCYLLTGTRTPEPPSSITGTFESLLPRIMIVVKVDLRAFAQWMAIRDGWSHFEQLSRFVVCMTGDTQKISCYPLLFVSPTCTNYMARAST